MRVSSDNGFCVGYPSRSRAEALRGGVKPYVPVVAAVTIRVIVIRAAVVAAPRSVAAAAEDENRVMHAGHTPFDVVAAARPLPDDLPGEVPGAENVVQKDLEVVAHGVIDVQEQPALRTEHPVQLADHVAAMCAR